jgi:hypothetical protein
MAAITIMMIMIIITTGRIVSTGRCDRPLSLHKDQGEAWVVPLECREVVAVAVAVAVARFRFTLQI